jgi:uncharacterized protein YdiU (UPF0061 family)
MTVDDTGMMVNDPSAGLAIMAGSQGDMMFGPTPSVTITLDAGGAKEIVTAGITGLTYPPGNTTLLAEAIHNLLSNRELRETLGKNAREYAKIHFCADRSCNIIIQRLSILKNEDPYRSKLVPLLLLRYAFKYLNNINNMVKKLLGEHTNYYSLNKSIDRLWNTIKAREVESAQLNQQITNYKYNDQQNKQTIHQQVEQISKLAQEVDCFKEAYQQCQRTLARRTVRLALSIADSKLLKNRIIKYIKTKLWY